MHYSTAGLEHLLLPEIPKAASQRKRGAARQRFAPRLRRAVAVGPGRTADMRFEWHRSIAATTTVAIVATTIARSRVQLLQRWSDTLEIDLVFSCGLDDCGNARKENCVNLSCVFERESCLTKVS